MGYSTQLPEWIILDPRPGRLRNAYSVTFDEEKPGLPEITDNDENVVRIVLKIWSYGKYD